MSSLAGNRVNPQKKTFHADKQESEAVKQLRLEYQLMMWAIETNNLVFIDESGTNLNMARTYARSKKGTRAHGCKPHNKGKNLTIIAAIAITGVMAALSFFGSTILRTNKKRRQKSYSSDKVQVLKQNTK